MKTKLIVVPNFKSFKKGSNEDGVYCLIHPQYLLEKQSTLWSHLCSNLRFAFMDLQYPNRRDFLDTIFDKDNWEFEFHEYNNEEDFTEYLKSIENPKIDINVIDDLFKEYEKQEKNL